MVIKKPFILVIVLSLVCISLNTHGEKVKTQGEFAIQLSKAIGLEMPTDDYIAQLEEKGITPEGGWQPDKPISNEEMASLLVRALGLQQEAAKRTEAKVEKAYRDRATILKLEGNVFVKLSEEEDWIPAKIGMKLSQKAAIKTAAGSWAELRVGMVGGVRIKENTELSLLEMTSATDGSENIILYMNVGELLVDARGISPNSDFQVRTPTTVAGVRGTIYTIKVAEGLTELKEAR